MRNRLFLMMILALSIFALPLTAYAIDDTTPPVITATIDGIMLHVEAHDTQTGVEAIFIDENRVNYRVDGALNLLLSDYADTGEYVSVYATDFAGNKSNTVTIINPFYVSPVQVPEETETQIGLTPFTPDGTGTVMENATDEEGKEFFTITTDEDNVFYLVIDRQRNSNNVYLLNAVTEDDLKALSQKIGKVGESFIPTPQPEPVEPPTPEPEPPPVKKSASVGSLAFILLAAIAAGGAGYYFKILKPKRDAQNIDEDDEYESEDELQEADKQYTDDYSDNEYLDDDLYKYGPETI